MARKRLGEILIQAGVLDEARLRAALNEQQRWGGQLGRILVEMKLITEEALVQALSHQLNFPAVRLEEKTVPQRALDLIPVEMCEQHGVFPFHVEGKFLDVAMTDPTNLGIIDELRIRTRLNVRAYLSGPKAIERAILYHYRGKSLAANSGMDQRSIGASHPMDGAPQIEFDHSGQVGPQSLGGHARRDPFAVGATTPSSGTLYGVPTAPPHPTAFASPTPQAARTGSVGMYQPHAGAQLTPVPSPVPLYPPVQAAPAPIATYEKEIVALQQRVTQLEALVARDEDVLRKLMGLLIAKGVCTREEILERIK